MAAPSALFYAYGKIRFARPHSSVDRASASGAEERSSSLRGGAKHLLIMAGVFLFYLLFNTPLKDRDQTLSTGLRQPSFWIQLCREP